MNIIHPNRAREYESLEKKLRKEIDSLKKANKNHDTRLFNVARKLLKHLDDTSTPPTRVDVEDWLFYWTAILYLVEPADAFHDHSHKRGLRDDKEVIRKVLMKKLASKKTAKAAAASKTNKPGKPTKAGKVVKAPKAGKR